MMITKFTGGRSMNDKTTKPAIEMVTLKQLCGELKVDPREARERLRIAVRDTKNNPELAKSHKSGHAWVWSRNSPALKEARVALTNG
jgi:hypothetical protein